ncbi:hypothetical protein ACM26W_10310 [Halomonas sp. HK25]
MARPLFAEGDQILDIWGNIVRRHGEAPGAVRKITVETIGIKALDDQDQE